MLRTRLLLSFALLILLFGVVSLWFGVGLINDRVVAQAQERVQLDLNTARSIYNNRLQDVEMVLRMAAGLPEIQQAGQQEDWDREALQARLEQWRHEFGLDFLSATDQEGRVVVRAAAPHHTGDHQTTRADIRRALAGENVSGSLLLGAAALEREGEGLGEQALLALEETPKARPKMKDMEDRGLVMVSAVPIRQGPRVLGTLYGGVVVNRNHDLIDAVSAALYSDTHGQGNSAGTATLFLMDTRVATTVRKENGNRALGTRVSKEVADQVLDNGKPWIDRAFVVSEWYLTAYEPIRDLNNEVVGILYVGILERPFRDLARAVMLRFTLITAAVGLLSLAVAFVLANRLARPIHRLVLAARSLEKGTYPAPVPVDNASAETSALIESFNRMVEVLQERENRLNETNRSLAAVNQNYMETLSFVSHELNNPINAAMNYAYMLKNQLIGSLEEKQLKAASVIDTCLERLSGMVRHYLELSRIERGVLSPSRMEVDAVEDLIQPVLDGLAPQLEERQVQLHNGVAGGLRLFVDREFGREIFENLINNAIKYGRKGGRIRISAEPGQASCRFTVWNEGLGIPADRMPELFTKFSRLHKEDPVASKVLGTGLGLFIVKNMIEAHGGTIQARAEQGAWAEFTFTLPQAVESELSADTTTPKETEGCPV